MAKYDYEEQTVKISRREFLGIIGVGVAMLGTGVYAVTDWLQDRTKYIKLRAQGLYKDDGQAEIRQSHNNPVVKDMYRKFAGSPGAGLAEELFHTRYVDRTKIG